VSIRLSQEAGRPLRHCRSNRPADAHATGENGADGKMLIDVTD
jgi:hypothetical protein